jgi:methylated-DNA-protein-cysteine methyltransferase-like protein
MTAPVMQVRIRAAIRNIPRGKVSTYGAVARAAGFPGAARQVVRALQGTHGLPWQRVVAAGGRIALPGERGFEQRLRLESEGVKFSGKKVRIKEFEHKFGKKKATAKSLEGGDAGRTKRPHRREKNAQKKR